MIVDELAGVKFDNDKYDRIDSLTEMSDTFFPVYVKTDGAATICDVSL